MLVTPRFACVACVFAPCVGEFRFVALLPSLSIPSYYFCCYLTLLRGTLCVTDTTCCPRRERAAAVVLCFVIFCVPSLSCVSQRDHQPIMQLTSAFRVEAAMQMGTLCCPLCGHFFPLGVNCQVGAPPTACHYCGTLCASTAPPMNVMNFVLDSGTIGVESPAVATLAVSATADSAPGQQRARAGQFAAEDAFCEKCGRVTRCSVRALQTRGADEGQTIFFQCTECQFEWLLHT